MLYKLESIYGRAFCPSEFGLPRFVPHFPEWIVRFLGELETLALLLFQVPLTLLTMSALFYVKGSLYIYQGMWF